MTAAAPPHVETVRLRLRPAVDADAPVIYASYATDPEVTRYLTWRPHADIAETRAFIGHCREVWDKGEAFPYVILRKEDGALLGMIEVRVNGHRAEMGYVLGRPYWGKGYMPEALGAILHWTSAQESISRTWAYCDVENRASQRVLEKAGMIREGRIHRWMVVPNLGNAARDCFFYCLPTAG